MDVWSSRKWSKRLASFFEEAGTRVTFKHDRNGFLQGLVTEELYDLDQTIQQWALMVELEKVRRRDKA